MTLKTARPVDAAHSVIGANGFMALMRQIAQPGMMQAARVIDGDMATVNAEGLAAMLWQAARRGGMGTALRARCGMDDHRNSRGTEQKLQQPVLGGARRGGAGGDGRDEERGSGDQTGGAGPEGRRKKGHGSGPWVWSLSERKVMPQASRHSRRTGNSVHLLSDNMGGIAPVILNIHSDIAKLQA